MEGVGTDAVIYLKVGGAIMTCPIQVAYCRAEEHGCAIKYTALKRMSHCENETFDESVLENIALSSSSFSSPCPCEVKSGFSCYCHPTRPLRHCPASPSSACPSSTSRRGDTTRRAPRQTTGATQAESHATPASPTTRPKDNSCLPPPPVWNPSLPLPSLL